MGTSCQRAGWRVVTTLLAVAAMSACGGEAGEGAQGLEGDAPPAAEEPAAPGTIPESEEPGAPRTTPGVAPTPPTPRPLTGLYVHLADAPAFTPCGSAVLVTDIAGAAADSLDRAYLLARATPGEAVLASVIGRLVPDSAASGVRLLVDSIVAVEAGAGCPGEDAAPPLEGTAWQLVGLPARDEGLGAAGAWVRLEEDGTLSGFTGCRELTGSYTWTGARLRFTSLDTQIAMCEQAEIHERFLAALVGAGSYRYRDGGLDLLGEDGVVARLEEG